jgi:hypothetical protein
MDFKHIKRNTPENIFCKKCLTLVLTSANFDLLGKFPKDKGQENEVCNP